MYQHSFYNIIIKKTLWYLVARWDTSNGSLAFKYARKKHIVERTIGKCHVSIF